MLRFTSQRSRLIAIITVLTLTIWIAIFVGLRAGKSRVSKREVSVQKVVFRIGETELQVHVTEAGNNPLTMVNLHEDERTSVEAARAIQERHGGRLIRLVHSGVRRPTFLINGSRFSFDPNRIYSPAGIRATIRALDPMEVPDEAYTAISDYAARFVDSFQLGRQRALVALHNNDEEQYSIRSYLPGAPLEADTDQIFVSPTADPDNFYFVTDERFFRAFQEQGFNVILQDNRIRRDDGSLSVFAGRYGIPYVNVEAQNGHLDEQIRMLEAAVQVIESAVGKLEP